MASGRLDLKLLLILFAVLIVEAVLLLWPGHLAITGHEVDVFHATEAAIRLSMGQLQHVDFMTPLGVLAFKPIALFLDMGFGISTANMAGNILIGAVFLPFLVWVGARRLGGALGIAFGVLTLIMITAVVYGGDTSTVSMSMYYNRWGWAAVFIIAALLLLPDLGDTKRPRIDGAIVGLMLGFLLLLKITFFMVLAPATALILIIDRDWQRLFSCILAGVVVCLAATLVFGGLEFWRHYLLDLIFVTDTEVRPRPGKEFTEVLALPSFFPGTFCLLAAIVGLRKSGFARDGLVLFLLAPGFAYITYQNWGNDTKWLIPLGLSCFVWSRHMAEKRIYGWEGRTYFLVLGAVSLALIAPSFVNMTTSPVRNMAASGDRYVSVMRDPLHSGLIIERKRSYYAEARVLIESVSDPEPHEDEEAPEPLRLGDFLISKCTLKTGYYGLMRQMGDDLAAAGYADKSLALVDVANPLPLISSIKRLNYASPWYYGGTREAEEAEFLVVPKCPISHPTFRAYLNDLNEAPTEWKLVETQEHAWIFNRR